MSIKDNMKQAFNELKDSVVPGAGSSASAGAATADVVQEQSRFGVAEDGTEVSIVPNPMLEAPVRPYAPTPPPRRASITIIGEDATILGNITTGGNLEFHGAIRGDIDAKGDITIDGGKVLGNVNGVSIQLSGATVQGSTTAAGDVILDASSVIMGDVAADAAYVDGRIRGNVKTDRGTNLRGNSVLVGNVDAKTFSISEGARIIGSISVDKENVESYVFRDLEIK